MYALSQNYPIAFDMSEGFLHVDEQSLGSREGDFHRAKICQDLVPLIHAITIFSAGYGGEDILEAFLPVWWQ